MTYYQNEPKRKHGHSHLVTKICPQCLGEYTLGIDGTVNGCDECEGITRNADGMIIPNDGILLPNLLADLILEEK